MRINTQRIYRTVLESAYIDDVDTGLLSEVWEYGVYNQHTENWNSIQLWTVRIDKRLTTLPHGKIGRID